MVKLEELGIRKQKEAQFNSKGIFCGEDLVKFLPNTYDNCTQVTGIRPENELSVIVGTCDKVLSRSGTKDYIEMKMTIAPNQDISIFWFNMTFMYYRLQGYVGKEILVIGKAKWSDKYRSWSISNPEVCTNKIQESLKIYPKYKKIQNMSYEYLSKQIKAALDNPACTQETCSYSIVSDCNLMPMPETLMELHNPTSQGALEQALYRIRFDDLLYFALRMELMKRDQNSVSSFQFPNENIYLRLIASLPFYLTEEQRKVLNEMIEYIRTGKRLNALLQGDVGCGKTIVAFLMMALAASNGAQAALMAPTKQLAQQHYEDAVKLFEPLGVTVAFMGDSKMKAAEKRKVTEGLADGSIQLVIGTHSLLSVEFKNLGLCVIDEEHKFGVMQRKTLSDKVANGIHCITMSATPIPRSLAFTLYADTVQVFTIKELPAGRMPTKTVAINDKKRLLNFIRYQHSRNKQTFVVCPAIEKSESREKVTSVETAAEWLRKNLRREGIVIETLTGRTSREDSEAILSRFKNNETHVLVATSVIEVGINIPTATGILILNSERFGLASLHQLRGRVGRSSDQGFCVLQGNTEDNPRIKALLSTNNGFEIAQADLQIRGPGDFLGTQQSGDDKYISLMLTYPETYDMVQKIARDTIDQQLSYPLFTKAKEDYASLRESISPT